MAFAAIFILSRIAIVFSMNRDNDVVWQCLGNQGCSSSQFGVYTLPLYGRRSAKTLRGLPVSTKHMDQAERGSDRDQFIDALRGLALLVLGLNHLGRNAATMTYEPLGFVTAAEVFIFLSGYVSGLVYTRTLDTRGFASTRRKAVGRAWVIYIHHAITFLLLFFLHRMTGGWSHILSNNDDWAVILAGLMLIHQPIFLDILPMYVLLLLLTPFLVAQFHRANGEALVLLISGAIWLLAQFDVRGFLFELIPHRGLLLEGDFDLLAWQILFVSGLIFGGRRTRGRRHTNGRLQQALVWSCFCGCVFFFALRHQFIALEFDVDRVFDKTPLRPLRILNFAMLAFLVAKSRAWIPDGWWLEPFAFLGRHSLQVFSFHIVFLSFANHLLRPALTDGSGDSIAYVLLNILALYLAAGAHRSYQNWRAEARR